MPLFSYPHIALIKIKKMNSDLKMFLIVLAGVLVAIFLYSWFTKPMNSRYAIAAPAAKPVAATGTTAVGAAVAATGETKAL
jgi:hypothetical protein